MKGRIGAESGSEAIVEVSAKGRGSITREGG